MRPEGRDADQLAELGDRGEQPAGVRRVLWPHRRERPNVLWTLFTVEEEDCPVVFRESELPMMVATLRSWYGRHVGKPVWEDFLRDLAAVSCYFAELWQSGDVAPPGPRVQRAPYAAVAHPHAAPMPTTRNPAP